MDPLTLYTIGSGLYNLAQGSQQASDLRAKGAAARTDAEQARLAGEEAFADLRDSTKYKVKQAPTTSAELIRSLSEQGLDFARDRALAQEAGTLAGLRDDPRNVGALLRQLNQSGQAVQQAEQRAGREAVTAQKIIDDSIFNQQEAERQRLSNLQQKYELDPAMAGYTGSIERADAFDDAARATQNQAISDSLAAGAQALGMMKDKPKKDPPKDDPITGEVRTEGVPTTNVDFNEVPTAQDRVDAMTDIGLGGFNTNVAPFTAAPVQPVGNVLTGLDTYEPATAPLGVPTLNAVNPNAVAGDPVAALLQGMPQADRDVYRPAPTAVEPIEPFNVTALGQTAPRLSDLGLTSDMDFNFEPDLDEDLDVYGVNSLSPTYQGSGNVLSMSPLNLGQQVYGGMNFYNPLGYEEGGRYIGQEGGRTEGEFNHKTNKKAIIDEESGEKEGELTGDETVITNPEQWENLESVKELLEHLAENPEMPKKEMKALLAKANKMMEFMDEPQFS